MPDKDLTQGQQLAPADKTRYAEVESGVYCQGVGAYSMGTPTGGGLVQSATFIEQAAIDGRAV